LTIDGAATLADAFLKYPSNLELAFQEYNSSFRPFIEEIRRPWLALAWRRWCHEPRKPSAKGTKKVMVFSVS
jgi:hypothetical protein